MHTDVNHKQAKLEQPMHEEMKEAFHKMFQHIIQKSTKLK